VQAVCGALGFLAVLILRFFFTPRKILIAPGAMGDHGRDLT
jgi:hypothetical protein